MKKCIKTDNRFWGKGKLRSEGLGVTTLKKIEMERLSYDTRELLQINDLRTINKNFSMMLEEIKALRDEVEMLREEFCDDSRG